MDTLDIVTFGINLAIALAIALVVFVIGLQCGIRYADNQSIERMKHLYSRVSGPCQKEILSVMREMLRECEEKV